MSAERRGDDDQPPLAELALQGPLGHRGHARRQTLDRHAQPALELRAAEVHRAAAESARTKGKKAVATFHDAAAKMHDAAAGDDYAGDFEAAMSYRAGQREPTEKRANRDENGRYHDGSPEAILGAAQGRMQKAKERHGTACAAYRAALIDQGTEHPDTISAAGDWQEARSGHQAAIDAADQAAADVTAIVEARMAAHRALIAEHRAKWASPEYANPAASTAGTAGAVVAAQATRPPPSRNGLCAVPALPNRAVSALRNRTDRTDPTDRYCTITGYQKCSRPAPTRPSSI